MSRPEAFADSDAFLGFAAALRVNVERSPFAKENDSAKWFEFLLDEVAEAREALLLKPQEDYAAELGDCFQNLVILAILNERAGGVPMAEVIDRAEQKIRLRKPWIFDATAAQPTTGEQEHEWFTKRKAELRAQGKT